MRSPFASYISLLALSALPARVLGGDVLSTSGFTTCVDNPSIIVNNMNIQFDRSTNLVTFDVSGTSTKVQNVTATIVVTAYGKKVYGRTFKPCDQDTLVEQLCPVPAGTFAAVGSQTIPAHYASMVPSIAYTVPDLDGAAKLELTSNDNGEDLACIESTVSNGKSMNVPAVTYVAVGVAGAALALSAVGTIVGGGFHAGATAPSPTFGEVVGWFQGIATNGMLSVTYPAVYQSFAKNFAFSTGLIPWGSMQTQIDNFRKVTGGNLTNDNYEYLKNATLVYSNGGNSSSSSSIFKRGLDEVLLYARESISTSVNGTSSTIGNGTDTNSTSTTGAMHYVHGIESYVEQLTIPQANTFMTVLLIFAIVIAAITVGILLLKVILETFALMGNLPKSLNSFRKRYWWRLAKTIVNLILVLYGIWTLYCVYQFTNGDSWAAKVLAGVTWTIFTAVLLFFVIKIWLKVREYRKLDGDHSQMYENKETWIKYSLFYDSFKKGYWWLFIPTIIYTFARNTVIAAANGHGLVQTIGQLAVEFLMLALLLWSRPYTLKSGNVINIIIQVVRVISVVCVLVFVEELGISQSTKTITGVVLIVVQSVLTGVLAILIAVNAIVACVRMNPHRKQRKEAEKMNRDLDNLTPLDARNSLLVDPTLLTEYKGASSQVSEYKKAPLVSANLPATATNKSRYDPVPKRSSSPWGFDNERTGRAELTRDESHQHLVSSAASMGGRDRSYSPPSNRQPRLPDFDFGRL
ncbi:hypothetical protein MBLNU459_g4495t1 [Dothideomycetes sp. NU459]